MGFFETTLKGIGYIIFIIVGSIFISLFIDFLFDVDGWSFFWGFIIGGLIFSNINNKDKEKAKKVKKKK